MFNKVALSQVRRLQLSNGSNDVLLELARVAQ